MRVSNIAVIPYRPFLYPAPLRRPLQQHRPAECNVEAMQMGIEAMSAMGQKQTSRAIAIYVRYWGQSGHTNAR